MSLKEEKKQALKQAKALVKKALRHLIPLYAFFILFTMYMIILTVYIIFDSINCGLFTVKDIKFISLLFISVSVFIAYITVSRLLDYINIKNIKGYFIKQEKIYIYKKGSFIRIELKDENNHIIKLISVVDITEKTPLNKLNENKIEFFYTGGRYKYLLFYVIDGIVSTTFYNTLSMRFWML